MVRVGAGAGALLAVLGVTSSAEAQEWLKDRRYSEGSGVKTGDFEIHPGIAAEMGYDSNWFLRTDKDCKTPANPTGGCLNGPPSAEVLAAGMLRVTPSLSINSAQALQRTEGGPAPDPSVRFRAAVDATYRQFFGPQDVSRQSNLGGHANARADILPGKPWGAAVFAGYTRTIQPQALGNPDASFNRSDINAGIDLIAQPNSGTLDFKVGYAFYAALFEQSEGVPFTNYTHEISAGDRWKFTPRTSIFQDTQARFTTFPHADRSVNFLNDSTPLKTRFGLNGLITSRISTLVAVGYGTTLAGNGSSPATRQFDSVTAQAEGTFFLSPNPASAEPGSVSLALSSFTLGYSRDFSQSYFGNFYGSDKGYGKLSYFFAGKAILSLGASVSALQYPDVFVVPAKGAPPVLGQTAFTNIFVSSTLFGEYRLTDAFGINATIDYGKMISDVQLSQGGPLPFHLSWQRFQGFLGVRYFL